MIASGFYSSTSPQLQTSDRKVRDRYLRSITRPIKRSASQFIQKPLVGESFRVTCYARVQITYSQVGSDLEFAPLTESITSMWPLLEGTLPHIRRAGRFGSEWGKFEKYLLREIEKDPLRVIRFYRLMHEVAGRPSWFREHNEQTLLEIGLKNKESRDATLSLIDLIARMGDLRYRELYEQYTKSIRQEGI